jgi:hypothetical protein
MVGLIDIAPATEQVAGVTVYGVSLGGVARLLGRFPELRRIMSGVETAPDDLFAMMPDALAAIIAEGVGTPDADGEQLASRLSIDLQVEFLAAIMRLTMPKGVGPFVEKMVGLGLALGGGAPSEKAQATTSPKPPKA